MRSHNFVAKFFTVLIIGHLLSFMPGWTYVTYPPSYTTQATQWQQTRKCGPDCPCGCQAGRPCTCYQNYQQNNFQRSQQSEVNQWQGSRCGANCPCGCQQGRPCTCYQNSPEANYNTSQANNIVPEEDDNSTSCNNDVIQDYFDDEDEDDICYKPILHVDPTLQTYESCTDGGIWLPDDPVLLRPFMADPREVDYSVGWRFNDQALVKNVIDVSFGDTIAIYRWCNIWPWGGELQIEIEGAVWAVFDPLHHSAPLMNADYYVGFPLTYAIDRWQFRLRGYHISSHIGDEFLLDHPGFDRRNASAEYLDFFISHDLTDEIRLYGGVGMFVRQDKEFRCKRFYSALGAELRLLRLGFLDKKDLLYGCPIFAMHFRQNGEFKKHVDATYILGYEFGKLCGLYRKVRFFMEYHDGYSVEGQFFKTPTNYFSLRMSYGF